MGNFRNRGGRGDYRRSFNNKRPPNRGRSASFANPALKNDSKDGPRTWLDQRASDLSEDTLMGFKELPPGSRPRVGWLVNMVPGTVEEPRTRRPVQAVDLFFLADAEGGDFRASIISRPYMYLAAGTETLRDVETALRRKFTEVIADISIVRLEDTSTPNHLAQHGGRPFLKLEARTTGDLYAIRQELAPIIERNNQTRTRAAASEHRNNDALVAPADPLDSIVDMREYDVAPVNRLAIDKKINVGYWYRVSPGGEKDETTAQQDYEEDLLAGDDPSHVTSRDPDMNDTSANDLVSARLTRLPEIVERASPVVLAYDIECTKKPLKFPNPEAGDQVMMISWMVDGQGYLGINREVVAEDIDNFEYKPHDTYNGAFQVFNEANEKGLLLRFFKEVRLAAPRVFATFNGDYFDWPFVEKRASLLGIDMGKEIGMRCAEDHRMSKQTKGRAAIHMDVFHWVNRDSYLPQGSRGLKAVTRTLLGFEPEEIPPEEMMAAAQERPKEMARYSVSDAVCTYYLYMKYVHPFIFSLCNIIPLNPDDVLRKGSGTLCEMLLMCQAREKRIVAPNKYNGTAIGKLTEDGHVLQSETYVGGHVEAIRTGVYREDIPLAFDIDKEALIDLEESLDDTLHFAITVEGKTKMEDVTNYDEIKQQIIKELRALGEKPKRSEKPLIYHLDVSAMYPNIILTNRLQPHAIVSPAQCAACDFNGMSECQRDMTWTWRGEHFPASRGEAEMIQRRTAQEQRELEHKKLAEARKQEEEDKERNFRMGRNDSQMNQKNFRDRPQTEQKLATSTDIANFDDVEARRDTLFRDRLKEYCRVNYRKTQDTRVTDKTATVCQRENPFYVDTVRAFRDRRYEYKALLKKHKKLKSQAKEADDKDALQRADNLVVLYDSMQLAHKCILNSFYGYVMRKGARWYSMEMAGIVTNTGGLIIRRAREFIEKVGLPLELDTDGIWCVLPRSFPENFSFNTRSGKKVSFSYICSVFNADVAANFTNHQYQDLIDPGTFEYSSRSECSILFEVDGPYKAMVLPASLEEGKSIKKRYAVFNDDGSIAELKGFEIKRRGELKLIKEFQKEIFSRFLEGSTITECYAKVGETCNKWLDVLVSQGKNMSDSELLELLVEQNNMSKPLEEYILAGQKSCAITCAGRMSEFLGAEIVRDKGLATMYVIAKKPEDFQVTARAIPVQIFEFPNETVRKRLIRKWMKSVDNNVDLRQLLDWEYYKGRLANAVLKIVSIPAALQAVDNPVPRIEYPQWLMKKCNELKDQRKQQKLSSFFASVPKGDKAAPNFSSFRDSQNDTEKMTIDDIEDIPLGNWTVAKVAKRQAQAAISRKEKKERRVARLLKKTGRHADELACQSSALDSETRAVESRTAMVQLLKAPHPDKRRDYAGWVQYAKKVWRAQRATRVRRYAQKRAREEESTEEKEDSSDTEEEEIEETNSKEIFGGQSFAEKYGLTSRKRKRRKNNSTHESDYAPDNFVADFVQGSNVKKDVFFSNKKVGLLGPNVVWQNIAISPIPDRPGEFSLWVLPIRKQNGRVSMGNLHRVPVHMKRVLYYNSKTNEAPDIPGVACTEARGLILPRSRPLQNLYRLELSEARFQQTDKDLSSTLNDAGAVDGVFGSHAPLEYDAIVTLGTLCQPRKKIISRKTAKDIIQKGISIEDILPKGPDVAVYLPKEQEVDGSILNQAFLYGSHASDGSSRALYLIVAPAGKLVHAVVVSGSRQLSINVKRLWRRIVEDRKTSVVNAEEQETSNSDEQEGLLQTFGPGAEVLALPTDCEYKSTNVKTREEAWSELETVLASLRQNSRLGSQSRGGSRTILLVQWPVLDTNTASDAMFGKGATKSDVKRNISVLEHCVPITQNYPVVRISNNADDGNYMPVGWETHAITTALSRYADSSNWLPSHLDFARFAGIPIGNISASDIHLQALDVMIGRELMNRDHILWASESPKPDLGGVEDDDVTLHSELQTVPEVTTPGSYRNVCVDTELSNLSIATILSSSYVNQLEGTDLAFDAAVSTAKIQEDVGKQNENRGEEGTIGGKTAAPLDEMASSASAFRIIKQLVTTWDKAASSNSAPAEATIARSLLDHLHRWTRSESAMLYDPALSRFVSWLIKKVFRQLVSELKTLGALVVYASMSRVILATPKTQTIDGLRYAGFLEKTLKEKPLFRHIHFQPLIGVYSGLLFIDRFNYGALPVPEETAILSGNFGGMTQQPSSRRIYASSEIPYARMMWDIARYLPIPVAVLWTQVVEEFIRRPMIQRLRTEEEEDAEVLEETAADDTSGQNDDEAGVIANRKKKRLLLPRGDGFVDEVRLLVENLTGQLLEKVHEIREKTPSLKFPNVPSSLNAKGTRRNPALEFVRTLCHVLSLDNGATEQVISMRRNLLQLLGVREFAHEAQFIDPALPVPLHDVICTYCNAVVDLDVARDSRLWTESEHGNSEDKSHAWACEYCGNPYDMRQIELDLIRIAQKLCTSYQVQDVVCVRCHMVKRDNMTIHCSCSGAPFQLTVDRKELRKQLFSLQSVANFHKFEFLQETVEWMSQSLALDIQE